MFKEKIQAIEHELKNILSRKDTPLYKSMRYSVLSPGKRFRPLLMLSVGDYFSVERKRILPFACSIELIHNYSLIHDDLPCMDNDDFRRGKPSSHKTFGEDIALLTGDGLLTMAFELMSASPSNNKYARRKEKAIQEICRLAGPDGMIEGQFLDITYNPDTATESSLSELILKKTGGLILAAVTVGGILAEALPTQMKALKEYGLNVGLAFQIRDDIQDAVKDKSENQSARPNAAHFFGIENSKKRLLFHIQKSLSALETGSIHSEELCFLANKLRDVKE